MEITPFDQFVSDDFLQIIKIMIPYLPDNIRRTAGIYVKLSELSNALRKPAFPFCKTSESSILQLLSPYLPSEFRQYTDMLEMMQGLNLEELMQTMNINDIFQEERNE